MVKYAGLVEGFYWSPECAVEGRYGEFDAGMRLRLLEFMARKGLNTYVYDPKLLRGDNYERAYSRDKLGDPLKWKETFDVARKNGIEYIWGIAPGRFENWDKKPLQRNVEYILGLGADGIMLLFDDVPGGSTLPEMRHQARLATQLDRLGGKVKGLCPGKYSGTKKELEDYLRILDENMPTRIPFILTGKKVWCDSINVEDLPNYLDRKLIIWDNWMASDTNDAKRLEFHPPQARSPELFDHIEGYLLNPCFPVERIVPMVSSVGELIEKRITISERKTAQLPNGEYISWWADTDRVSELLGVMGKDWADFLQVDAGTMQRLIHKKVAREKVDIPYQQYVDIVRKWPSIRPLFE